MKCMKSNNGSVDNANHTVMRNKAIRSHQIHDVWGRRSWYDCSHL